MFTPGTRVSGKTADGDTITGTVVTNPDSPDQRVFSSWPYEEIVGIMVQWDDGKYNSGGWTNHSALTAL